MKLIKNGIIVTSEKQFQADILIEGDKIVEIASHIPINDDVKVIDATNKFILPGFIDAHTHFDLGSGTLKSADDFSSGTKAAISGGTCTIIDFATQNKNERLKDGYNNWLEKAKNKSSCNYRFHMAISEWNDDIKKEMVEMPELGITSFKMYMAYDALLAKDDAIYECLKEVKKINGILGVHCENGLVINEIIKDLKSNNKLNPAAHALARPDDMEAEAIYRLGKIAKMVDYPVMVVHLSSKKGLDIVRQLRADQQEILVETCPQYLLLDDSKYDLANFEGAKYVISPPLRKKKDNEALIEAIINNEIQTIATDHCSFSFEKQKKLGLDDFTKIPNGAPGVQNRGILIYSRLVHSKKITIERMVDLLATKPAELYDIYPKKGVIQVGSDADIVILDPMKDTKIEMATQYSKCDYTLFENEVFSGYIEKVLLNGQVVVENGKIIKENQGSYVRKGQI